MNLVSAYTQTNFFNSVVGMFSGDMSQYYDKYFNYYYTPIYLFRPFPKEYELKDGFKHFVLSDFYYGNLPEFKELVYPVWQVYADLDNAEELYSLAVKEYYDLRVTYENSTKSSFYALQKFLNSSELIEINNMFSKPVYLKIEGRYFDSKYFFELNIDDISIYNSITLEITFKTIINYESSFKMQNELINTFHQYHIYLTHGLDRYGSLPYDRGDTPFYHSSIGKNHEVSMETLGDLTKYNLYNHFTKVLQVPTGNSNNIKSIYRQVYLDYSLYIEDFDYLGNYHGDVSNYINSQPYRLYSMYEINYEIVQKICIKKNIPYNPELGVNFYLRNYHNELNPFLYDGDYSKYHEMVKFNYLIPISPLIIPAREIVLRDYKINNEIVQKFRPTSDFRTFFILPLKYSKLPQYNDDLSESYGAKCFDGECSGVPNEESKEKYTSCCICK